MAKLLSKVRTKLGGARLGVQLLPGRTTVVDDADVERLLAYGEKTSPGGKRTPGLGERLVADKSLVVQYDGSSTHARKTRISTYVAAVVAMGHAASLMSREELDEAEPLARAGLIAMTGTDQIAPAERDDEAPSGEKASVTRADAPKMLTAETLAKLSVAKAKPLIAAITDTAVLEVLTKAEQDGEKRKGMLDLLEDRALELIHEAEKAEAAKTPQS